MCVLLSSARTCVRMLYLDDRTLALPWRLVYAQQVLGVDDSKTQDYHTLARAHFLSRMHTAKASTHALTRSWTSMTPSRSTSARSVRQDAARACARASANDGRGGSRSTSARCEPLVHARKSIDSHGRYQRPDSDFVLALCRFEMTGCVSTSTARLIPTTAVLCTRPSCDLRSDEWSSIG